MKLSELQTGETGIITKILGHGSFRKRVMEMGFVKGKPVTTLLYAPLQDPIKYSILGYEVSLRRSEAELIDIIKIDTPDSPEIQKHRNLSQNVVEGQHVEREESEFTPTGHHIDKHEHVINVALIGNPNCGKTSLFNIASGSSAHVGNYSGVTVDAKSGKFEFKGYKFNIVDLPGTYSLASYSP